MKSGLNAGGFIGAERIRDVSSAKCRCKAPCSAVKRADTRSRRKSASAPLGAGRPRRAGSPQHPPAPEGYAEIWKKSK